MAIAKKKKRFYDVQIPIINRTTQLIALDPAEMEGRIIKYDLTRILRGKNILLDAVVKKEGDDYVASPVGMRIMINFLKRMVRKGTDYVEGSFVTNSKDAKVEIKFLLVTRRRVSREVRKALRKKAKDELTKYLGDNSIETIFEDLMRNKLQKELSFKLKKIYPLSLCEIRSFRIVGKVDGEDKVVKEKKVEEEDKKVEDNLVDEEGEVEDNLVDEVNEVEAEELISEVEKEDKKVDKEDKKVDVNEVEKAEADEVKKE